MSATQAYLSVAILIFVGGFIGAGFCGFQVNHIDLSPNHSGMLMAISNSCTSVFSVLSPLTVQYIVIDQVLKFTLAYIFLLTYIKLQTNQEQWRIIFFISAAVYVITDLFFIAFASGRVQEWNSKLVKTENNPQYIENGIVGPQLSDNNKY